MYSAENFLEMLDSETEPVLSPEFSCPYVDRCQRAALLSDCFDELYVSSTPITVNEWGAGCRYTGSCSVTDAITKDLSMLDYLEGSIVGDLEKPWFVD